MAKLSWKYCAYCGFETFHNGEKCLTHNTITKKDRKLLHDRMHKGE